MKKNRLTIGLIIPYYQDMFSTFYTLEIIKEVSRVAIRLNTDLLIETAARKLGISGIIFADLMGNEQLIKKVRKKKIPYIILNYYDQDSIDNCIGIDNEKASFDVVSYLTCVGHSRIAMITGKLSAQAGIQRLEGYKRALQAKKIKVENRYIVIGNWTKTSGKRAMKKLLRLRKSPTAVFVAGDEMALGAIEAAGEAGVKVPEDVSLIGFDNIPEAASVAARLSTVEQPFPRLAELGIKYLIQIIQKKLKQPVKILLGNTKLIKRASVKELKVPA